MEYFFSPRAGARFGGAASVVLREGGGIHAEVEL